MSHLRLKRTQADSLFYSNKICEEVRGAAPLYRSWIIVEMPKGSVDRTDLIPLFEGGLDEAKSVAGHLKAAGIEYDIGMTDGSNPGS